jgi:hypothetical protein
VPVPRRYCVVFGGICKHAFTNFENVSPGSGLMTFGRQSSGICKENEKKKKFLDVMQVPPG